MRQLKITNSITNRDSKTFEKYLKEMARYELISPEKEVELAMRIRQGDKQAKDELVNANLRFVVSVAKQYQNQGLTLNDLISFGNMGLIIAAGRFDETMGFKFISYAVWWIRQSILQALAEQARIVRLPLNKIGSINKINKAFNKLEQKFQREPTIDEVAQLIEARPEMVEDSMNFSSIHVSMDAPLRDEEANNMYDIMLNDDSPSPDNELMDNSLRKEIERSLSTLGEREAEILRCYFGLKSYHPHTLEEIGDKFGLTRERVRQIKEKAIKKLKNQYRNRLLKSYLGK